MPHKFTIEDHEERMRKILTPPKPIMNRISQLRDTIKNRISRRRSGISQ